MAVGLALAFLLELNAAPIRFWDASPEVPPVYRWLAGHDLHGGSILELPIDENSSETTYMFRATSHHRRIVNGVSGFAPPSLVRIERLAHKTPIPPTFLDQLRRIGCRYIVVHWDTGGNTPAIAEWLAAELAAGRLRFVRRFDAGMGGDWLFTLDQSYVIPQNDVSADRGGLTREAQLQMFLKKHMVCSDGTFGFMELPMPGEVGRPARFTGWALSPYGIREIRLLLNNGSVRLPTMLSVDAHLSNGFPCYPETSQPRFTAVVEQRPPGVWRKTEVQVEIVDGRGGIKRLEPRWIHWR